jgi:hypothetical protein
MTEFRWQFSLRSLLGFTALLAAVIAIAANRPRTASVCLMLAAPFLVVRVMPLVFHYVPRQAHWIFAVVGAGYTFACASLFVAALRAEELGWRLWLVLSVLMAFGVLCFCLAWTGASQATKNVD